MPFFKMLPVFQFLFWNFFLMFYFIRLYFNMAVPFMHFVGFFLLFCLTDNKTKQEILKTNSFYYFFFRQQIRFIRKLLLSFQDSVAAGRSTKPKRGEEMMESPQAATTLSRLVQRVGNPQTNTSQGSLHSAQPSNKCFFMNF